MHQLDFWFDVISPYAHLAFHRLPVALQGLSVSVRYKPVLFAGLLKHHGQLGPAEIAPKKQWTFRQVGWHARELGISCQAPAEHPFNPLPLLRLLLALGPGDGTCNRYHCEQVFAHVWQSSGQGASEPVRIQTLAQRLLSEQTGDTATPDAVHALLNHAQAKAQLQANGEEALKLGLFGVPSAVHEGQVFWGLDALPLLRARLIGDPWFSSPAWTAAAPSAGVRRK